MESVLCPTLGGAQPRRFFGWLERVIFIVTDWRDLGLSPLGRNDNRKWPSENLNPVDHFGSYFSFQILCYKETSVLIYSVCTQSRNREKMAMLNCLGNKGLQVA